MPERNQKLIISSFFLIIFIQIAHSQNCPASYFFNSQRCAPCKQNCLCSQENTFTSCLPCFTYDALFENCLQCPTASSVVNVGCKECCYQVKGPAFVCSSCPAGQYVFDIGGQCIQLAGCLNINTQGSCTSCASGFYLYQGTCTACDASCATCPDSSYCLTCNTGYFNATDISYSLCQACSLGCKTCTSGSACTMCNDGFRISGGTCSACTSNCITCTALVCNTCNALSGLISGICYLCTDSAKQGSAGCLTCTSNPTRILCTSCAAGYFLDSTTQACVQCSTQYPNSILCTATNIIQCANDQAAILTSRYYLVGNTCVQNLKNCKDMKDSSGKCSSCYFSPTAYYSLNSGTGACVLCNNVVGCLTYSSTCVCTACQNGYQFINNQCNACQNLHCHVCQTSISACQGCAPSYGRMSSACVLCQRSNCYNCDGDNTVCAVCNIGYYLNSGKCYSCQANCVSCVSNTKCTSCIVGTYLQSNGRCKTLPDFCIDIDTTTLSSSVGSCKRCQYGYILIEGNCYPCSSSLFNVNHILFSWIFAMTSIAQIIMPC